MTNIWGFLLQTLSVFFTAAILLLVKWLLREKLSPRWQYGIWGVLAVRIVVPVWTMKRSILLPLPLWLETLKGLTENALNSAYSGVYEIIKVYSPIPWIIGRPESITDWVFVAYVGGVLAVLLWYLLSYARLRLLLWRGNSLSDEMREQIEAVCSEYHLQPCHAVEVAGLTSAFVCGVFRPILVIPAGTKVDQKVMRYELLHFKRLDAAQSIGWRIFRALHWCNPFLQFVFNMIGNDMETLYDQRVMERLTDEQRSEYGDILLTMDKRYYRAPGTTSLSNGGKHIARRIASIARFKEYPKGMELVSVCIAVVLLSASLFGASTQGMEISSGKQDSWSLVRAMASARVTRCTTVAGALDTYAKGLLYDNGIYLAVASPLSSHKALAKEMRYNAEKEGWVYYHLESGLEGTGTNNGYSVYNLKKLSEGEYEALLVFNVPSLRTDDDTGYQLDEYGNPCAGMIVCPVRVSYEDAWVVRETGERQGYPSSLPPYQVQYGNDQLPDYGVYQAAGKSGTVTVQVQMIYNVDNTVPNSSSLDFMGMTTFDRTLKPNAKFTSYSVISSSKYIFNGSNAERARLHFVGFQTIETKDVENPPDFPNSLLSVDGSGSGSDGSSWDSRRITDDWDGTLTTGGGRIRNDIGRDLAELPAGYAAQVFWDGVLRETLVLKEVTANGTAAAD